MRPRISPGDEPPFHELDEYRFQKLCRDLFTKEPDIASALVYGVRGEPQQGIDVRAQRRRNDGIEVGQCKRYNKFSPAQIRQASDEFFAHWAYWQTQHVRRFILFVTADISSRQHIAAINEQRQRFLALGIEYEPWPPDMIQNKLRDHHGIVATYLTPPDFWVQTICGVINPGAWRNLTTPVPTSAAGSHQYYSRQIESLAASWSLEVERRLDEIRMAWHEGRKDEAPVWLYQIKRDEAVWLRIATAVRARVLLFEARVKLDLTGDTLIATQLVDEAHRLAPDEPDYVIRAFIAYREHDPETALTLITDIDDIKCANLRAAFLLELGRLEAARAVLEHINTTLIPTADTFRLGALFSLITKDLGQAQLAVQRARDLSPRWETVRLADALINYYSVLSSAALPGGIPPVPAPVDWVFVKQDDASLARLRLAAATFGDLAELAYDSAARGKHLAWRMASLANDPEAQDDALALCQVLLQDASGYGAMIPWVVVRGYPIDLTPIVSVLERCIRTGDASIHDVLALLECRVARSETQRALNLLERTRSLFEQHQVLWGTKHLQMRVLKGERKAIAAALAPIEETVESLHLKALALRVNAERTDTWQPLCDHLTHCVEITGDAGYLFELCDLLARQNQWDAVADRAEQLTTTVGTPIAVRLAAFGLFNAGRYNVCLTLLDMHRGTFRERLLPPELKRMRALCLLKLGVLSEAADEATRLAQEEPTTANLLALIDVHVDQGDWRQVAVVARSLRDHSDLPVEQALRLASLTRSEDLQLARVFWRQAIRLPIADDLVGYAYGLGMQLGLDTEMRNLTAHLVELGASGRGGIKAFSIPDLLEFAQQRREHHARIDDLYRRGDGPIHIVSEFFNVSLVELYHLHLLYKENATHGWIQRPLLARHGSRLLAPGSAQGQTSWRLHIDITAILLAAHLEVLDVIEATFAPLRIPASLMSTLLAMREQLAHHQPSKLDACRHIAALVRQKRLYVLPENALDIPLDSELSRELDRSWAALHTRARNSRGYVVDFLPLTKRDLSGSPAILPDSTERYVTNCRAVIEALKQYGPLSETASAVAIDALGEEGRRVTNAPTPAPGVSLFCHGNIPEVLADAGVLDIATTRFRVFIEQDEADRASAALIYDEQRQETTAWLVTLIDRIRQGLETGTYQRIAESTVERHEREDRHGGIFARCLTDLFAFSLQEGDVIWIDDRFANAYIYRDTAPIVGITDVLQAALSANALTVDQYYTLLSRLRAADVRFIPIESDEIVYALAHAHVDEQRHVIETSHLINLRRYAARCLLQGDMLQMPPLPERNPPYPNADGEVAFVLGLHHALDDALIAIWATGSDLEACRAQATWIVDNLMFDPLMARTVVGFPTTDDQKRLSLASHLAGLIMGGWGIARDTPDATGKARQAYREWLEHKLINPRSTAEPFLAIAIADILKQMMNHALDNLPAEVPTLALMALLHDQLELVATAIGDELKRDPEFMERLGITYQSVVTLEGLAFDPDEFWPAIEAVINGQPTSMIPINGQDAVLFEPVEDESGAVFTFEHPFTHKRLGLGDIAMRLLAHATAIREAIVRQNRHWFDCSDNRFEHVFAEIVTQPEPRQRVEVTVIWRNENMAAYYALLEEHIQAQQTFRLDQLRAPSADGLLRHFRLEQPSELMSVRELIDDSARTLLRELSLVETIDRLARLPVPLPTVVLDTVAACPTNEQRILIRQLLPLGDSPLSTFHLLRLLVRLGGQAPVFWRLARRLVSRLIAALEGSSFKAYFALLIWMHETFDLWDAASVWSPLLRISMVWAHTDKLFRVLVGVGVGPAWMVQTFASIQGRLAQELFERDPHIWYDVAHPRQQHPLTLLIAGLAYGLADSAPAILDDKIRGQLEAQVFPTINGIQIPAAALCVDPSQAPNALGAFLGGNYVSGLTTSWAKKAHDIAGILIDPRLTTSWAWCGCCHSVAKGGTLWQSTTTNCIGAAKRSDCV